ncbi:molybdopterin-dependent oxidoreductase [Thalassospira sp. HJ]|uniref:molybdopterin-dependent oxidoreductase n=1 Tax=Thalassospira sp. HJ TaxID=1616823 RepID=UPI001F2BA359|nr:molybdopterin-dependent oxidoreductase [Thalassospira sp. HJ]
MNNALKLIAVVISLVGFYAAPAMAGGTLSMTNTNGETVRVSMKELMDLQATEINTSTQWTDGVQKFRGVAFDLLLDTYGLEADTVRVSALNDYNVMVPADVLRNDGAILAYQLNDAEMSVREKGPFWVIFPYDADDRFNTDTYWAYSVWQVKSVDAAN